MKKPVSILVLCLLAFQLHAQDVGYVHTDAATYSVDSVLKKDSHSDSTLFIVGRFVTPAIFRVNRYDIKVTPQIEEAVDSIKSKRERIAYIWIGGSASPEGPLRWNRQLGQFRADALADYLVKETGMDRSIFHTSNLEEDWYSLEKTLEELTEFPNREMILKIISDEQDPEERKRRIKAIDGGRTWKMLLDEIFPSLRNARLAIASYYPRLPAVRSGTRLLTAPEDTIRFRQPEAHEPELPGWKISMKTNLLTDASLVANLGVEISPWPHWSIDIPLWYSPYSVKSTLKCRVLAVQPEIRWWFKEAADGHFVGLHTHVVGFNVALDGETRYQDPNHALWGLGLGYGYAIRLGPKKRLGLEFNIGAGFAKYKYDAYRNWENGPKFDSGEGCYWGITRAGITLSYRWDIPRRNSKD